MERFVVEGSVLRPSPNEQAESTYLLREWLLESVNIPINEDTIKAVMLAREVVFDLPFEESTGKERDLCRADLLTLLATSATKLDSQTEKDNGWSSTQGGYTLSESDKRRYLRMADALYTRHGEKSLTSNKVRVKIHHYGIRERRICAWDD